MSGRYRNSEGIIYPFTMEESKLNKRLELNIDLDSDIEKGFNIIVLAHQPGIGKTYAALEYMKRHPNSFYFTDRHSAIDEHTSDWEEKGIEYAHWKGLQQISSNETIQGLLNIYKLTPRDIFENYNWGRAKVEIPKYEKQFQNRTRVFAPFNYLKSLTFLSQLPDIVFIDERINHLEEYEFSIENIVAGLKLLDVPKAIVRLAETNRRNVFLRKGILQIIQQSYVNRVFQAVKSDDSDLLKELRKFNPYNLFGYIHWDSIYDYQHDAYAVPFYYYALDVVAQGKTIVILDASFNLYLFHYLLETYNGERKKLGLPGFSLRNARVKIYYSKHQNPESTIYRMRPAGSWSKTSIINRWDTEKEWISRDMQRIIEIFGAGNVGVITFKELAEMGNTLGFDLEYFGGLRGTNKLEDKPVLVILGGWFPPPPSWNIPPEDTRKAKDTLDSLVWKYFLKKLEKKDSKNVKAGAPSEIEAVHNYLGRGIAKFTIDKEFIEGKTPADLAENNPFNIINSIFFDEYYQSVHRNRPLRYPRLVFVYGWFPEPRTVYHEKDSIESDRRVERLIDYNLREEFGGNVEKVLNQWIEETPYKNGLLFFDWLATQYSQGKVVRVLREFEKGKMTKSPTLLANQYKIWAGSGKGVDNKLVEEFHDVYKRIKEAGKSKARGKKK